MTLLLPALLVGGCTTNLALRGMDGINHCSPELLRQMNYTYSTLQSLQNGEQENVVTSRLGAPNMAKAVTTGNGFVLNVLYYRTGHDSCRGNPTGAVEFTPVVFHNGRLEGYGHDFYEKQVAPHVVSEQQVYRDVETNENFDEMVELLMAYPLGQMMF